MQLFRICFSSLILGSCHVWKKRMRCNFKRRGRGGRGERKETGGGGIFPLVGRTLSPSPSRSIPFVIFPLDLELYIV